MKIFRVANRVGSIGFGGATLDKIRSEIFPDIILGPSHVIFPLLFFKIIGRVN